MFEKIEFTCNKRTSFLVAELGEVEANMFTKNAILKMKILY